MPSGGAWVVQVAPFGMPWVSQRGKREKELSYGHRLPVDCYRLVVRHCFNPGLIVLLLEILLTEAYPKQVSVKYVKVFEQRDRSSTCSPMVVIECGEMFFEHAPKSLCVIHRKTLLPDYKTPRVQVVRHVNIREVG